MKVIKRESIGIQPVYNTNVEKVQNYIGNTVINHNCVVDSDYQGEIHISLINTSNTDVYITEDMKIIQFIETPILTSPLEISTDAENFFNVTTARGEGGFGSSDKK